MRAYSNALVTAGVALWFALAGVAWAQPTQPAEPTEADLLARLALSDEAEWKPAEEALVALWSRSGSAAMDLLLERGRDAMEAEDGAAAIEHLTALTDHAPDFAEGWNARAMAWFAAGEYGLALADLTEALARNPHHFGALSGLGLTLERLGRHEAALRAFQAARSIHPHRPDLIEAEKRLERKSGGRRL